MVSITKAHHDDNPLTQPSTSSFLTCNWGGESDWSSGSAFPVLMRNMVTETHCPKSCTAFILLS